MDFYPKELIIAIAQKKTEGCMPTGSTQKFVTPRWKYSKLSLSPIMYRL
jgi:hypothetical protein